MIRAFGIIGIALLAGCSEKPVDEAAFGIAPENIRSGYEFLTAETQALQNDDFANPGLLWVQTGQGLFQDGGCAACHNDPGTEFRSVASTFPALDPQSGKLINLEGRINLCRTRHQSLPELPYESDDLLALTTFVKSRARGGTIDYQITDALQPHFAAGQNYFYSKRGQFNLSCNQCHDENAGAKMRGDTVSQGHINGFPAYRNDWQTLGSSHRRFEACDIAVRADPPALGSQTYLDLEVYLTARGNGLTSESPAIRR
ncbi:MAG: sulfur oxidation c-type cytochrome SoxA [Hellea sp.]|nr:sulfur oxidation c-type cytochrome SoxA [Hellea sp.]